MPFLVSQADKSTRRCTNEWERWESYKEMEGVAHAVAVNFDKLPEDIRNNLLVKLSEKAGVAMVAMVERGG
ncbi:hypothetical protein ACFLYR_05725 [Chloroflexota bacterium]